MFNISGQANFGGALMKIQTFETESLPPVNPAPLPKPDAAVYNALGLTPGERQAVQAGVTELANNRKPRARSAAGRKA